MDENQTPDIITTPPEKAKPRFRKGLYAVAIVCCLAIIGVSGWYLFSQKTSTKTAVQNDIEPAPALEPIPASKLAMKGNSLSDFDLAFLRLENKQDNVIYSPLSIKYALAMLKDAAAGNSTAQIEALIGDYKPKAYLNSNNLSLANAMFVRSDIRENIKSTYYDTILSKYNAEVVFDDFASAAPINSWVSNKTFNIINDLLSDNTVQSNDFVLINALAIDMKWNNRFLCIYGENDPDAPSCKGYNIYFPHEKYIHQFTRNIDSLEHLPQKPFNDQEVSAGTFGSTSNRYDIIKEIGEDTIRSTVQAAFDKWIASDERWPGTVQRYTETPFNMDEYIKELGSNYGKTDASTDFFFNITDDEQIFAKDLQEYDGSTLEFVAIMPKNLSLSDYLKTLTAEKATNLISGLKSATEASSYKDGVVTRLTAYFPFFKFNYDLSLKKDLISLGITDVFDPGTADLSNLTDTDGTAITEAVHKADIDFSNDGIKAAAATALVGGLGAAGDDIFDYSWELVIEDVELNFDKPFLFLIRDKATGEVWFTGTVYNPGN